MDDATERPRRGRPGYDQATVLRSAIALFNRQGYGGTSMGELAREHGFTKSAIHHHVACMPHLPTGTLDAALAELIAIVTTATEEALPEDGAGGRTAYDRLREVVEQSVRVRVAHQPAVTLLLRVRGNSEPELEALRRRRDLDSRLAT